MPTFLARAGTVCRSSSHYDAFFAMSATVEENITLSKFSDSTADEALALRPARAAINFLSRRELLAAAAAGGALVATGPAHGAAFGNPDEPPQGAVNSSPGALSDPGPQNP